MQQTTTNKQQKLYILQSGFTGKNLKLIPKYLLKELRTLERTFPSESRKLEWDLYSNCTRWILTLWDNGHSTNKFMVNHILPIIDHVSWKEDTSRVPKIILYINKPNYNNNNGRSNHHQ